MITLPFTSALLAAALEGVAILGCVQAAAGAMMVGRFRSRARAPEPFTVRDADLPPISVLKPLHGDEPMLEEALLGFITQDYPTMQIVFGVQSAADPAIAVVQRLRRRFPGRDLCLVVDSTAHGQNRKIGNLINMLPHARHDLLVISDSDIHVAPDYLRQVAGSFAADSAVGLVTTLYHGIPASPSLSRRLAAGQINHNFLPGVLLSRVLGRQDCLGSTMALRRETLEAIGGLPMLSAHVADDALLGKLVRSRGQTIAIAPSLTATTIAETNAADLFAHELRWGRTVRAVEPLGYALSSVQFPLFWAGLALAIAPHASWTWILFATIWSLRGVIAARIDQLIGLMGRTRGETIPFLLLPLRDWLSAAIMAASFAGSRVAWRGQMMHVSSWSPPHAATPPGVSSRPAARPILAHAHQTLAQGD
jgi:ceramide glucosyltransferase